MPSDPIENRLCYCLASRPSGDELKGVLDLRRDLFNCFIRNFWVNGKRQNAILVGIRIGKILWAVTKISVGSIKWESFGIVQNRCDARVREVLSYVIPVFRANNIEMINMVAADSYFRRHNFTNIIEKFVVTGG